MPITDPVAPITKTRQGVDHENRHHDGRRGGQEPRGIRPRLRPRRRPPASPPSSGSAAQTQVRQRTTSLPPSRTPAPAPSPGRRGIRASPAADGASIRRHGPAPAARAASAYSACRSTTRIARTPRATTGHPTSASTATRAVNTSRGRQHQRQHAAQREHDVDARQDDHEVRDAHQRAVRSSRRRSRPSPPTSAPSAIARSVASTAIAERQPRADQQPREDVAAERVAAEQKPRLGVGERGDPARSILGVAPLERIDGADRIGKRRVPRRRRRRSACGRIGGAYVIAGKLPARDRTARAAGAARTSSAISASSFTARPRASTRGSASACAMSAARMPAARNAAPAAAHPATR